MKHVGIPLTCESLTHSDVMNFNSRVVKRALEKASEGLWNSMCKYEIANLSKECDPIKILEDIERRDSKGSEVIKGNFIRLP